MSNGNKAPGAAGERRTFFVLLAIIMVATLGLSLYTFSTVAEREAEDSESLIHVRDIRLNSPELAQLSNEATRGNFDAFPQLRQVAEALDASVAHLGGEAGRILRESDLGQAPDAGAEAAAQGGDHAAAGAAYRITYTDPAVVEQINATAAVWADIAAQVNDVLEARVPLGNVSRLAGEA